MSSLVEIRPISTETLDLYWPEAEPMIKKAVLVSDGCYDTPHIYQQLKDAEKALFCIFLDGKMIAAVTTRIEKYPTGKTVCVIDFAGGEGFKKYWENFTDYIEPLYKSMGCDMITIAGRRGWERLHTDKGYEFIYQVIGKDLHG